MICSSCPDGYVIKGNKCHKNCETLESEGCDVCSNDINDSVNPPKCVKCKDGYFTPIPSEESNKCFKCALAGCKECTGVSEQNNTCTKCVEEKNTVLKNDKIISCYNTCEIGEGEKCKTCSAEQGKCASCNEEYILFEGTCNFCAFIAKYETTKRNERVELFLSIPIGKMKVDEVEVKNPSHIYTFPKPGVHEVCIKFDKVPMLSNLFANNRNVVSIVFSPSFDTSK